MIDIRRETLLTKKEVACRCKVSVVTVNGWITRGVGGRRLEAVKIGGAVRISEEALARFTVQAESQSSPMHIITDSARQAQEQFKRLNAKRKKGRK